MHEKVNLRQKLDLFDTHRRPKIVGRFNDNDLRVVKVKGEFVWHKHEDTDDFFLVLDGHSPSSCEIATSSSTRASSSSCRAESSIVRAPTRRRRSC